jgi:C4-dicarboxylate-specific signal transduction histidine kinase
MIPLNSPNKRTAFFGRIMANVSHEFNNVITVISELAGLLKDLAFLAQKGREIPPGKLESISDNISRQVVRGKNLITHMNRFSHSADEPLAKVDLGETVENMRVLTDRLFKNRQTNLSFTPAERACALTTNPFELRYIIFCCLDRFLESSSPDLSLSMRRLDNGREIELIFSGTTGTSLSEPDDRIEELREQVAGLNGRLTYELDEDKVCISLILPEGTGPGDSLDV